MGGGATAGRASVIRAGDAERLQQVLANVVSNAIRVTPHGGLVEIEMTSSDAQVIVAVRVKASRPSSCRTCSTSSARRTRHESEAAARMAGFTAFVAKPARAETLLRVVSSVLDPQRDDV